MTVDWSLMYETILVFFGALGFFLFLRGVFSKKSSGTSEPDPIKGDSGSIPDRDLTISDMRKLRAGFNNSQSEIKRREAERIRRKQQEDEEYDAVKRHIAEEARHGYGCMFSEALYYPVKERLRKEGFAVEDIKDSDGYRVKISWYDRK